MGFPWCLKPSKQIFGVSVVPCIAPNFLLLPLCLLELLAGCLGSHPPASLLGLSCFPLDFLTWPPLHQLLPGWLNTCMSEASSSTDVVELTLNFQGLRVTVAGPARCAAELVSEIARHHLPRDPSPSSDHYSFVDLASEAPQSRSSAVESPARPSELRVETRDSVERSFAACPDHLLREAGR